MLQLQCKKKRYLVWFTEHLREIFLESTRHMERVIGSDSKGPLAPLTPHSMFIDIIIHWNFSFVSTHSTVRQQAKRFTRISRGISHWLLWTQFQMLGATSLHSEVPSRAGTLFSVPLLHLKTRQHCAHTHSAFAAKITSTFSIGLSISLAANHRHRSELYDLPRYLKPTAKNINHF